MTTQKKSDRIAKNTKLARALLKHCAKSTIHIGGKPFKGKDLARQYQRDVELIEACEIAYAKWRQLVAEEREADLALAAMTAAISSTIANFFGVGSQAYNDFGLSERRVGRKSVETKANAAIKLRATRAARHTMGKRQRAAITATPDAPNSANETAMAPGKGTPH